MVWRVNLLRTILLILLSTSLLSTSVFPVLVDKDYLVNLKRDLFCLMVSYNSYITDIEISGKYVYLVMKSGERVIYDDFLEKNFEEKLSNGDLQDSMELIYPLDFPTNIATNNFDPGRVRSYEFLKAVYGKDKESIESKLTIVKTSLGEWKFNNENNAASKFKEALDNAHSLILNNEGIKEFVLPLLGTYVFRKIANSNQLSMHAFGLAVDLAPKRESYWLNASYEQGLKLLRLYPKQLVEIFESNGFIWGGKWAHFDLMHFEYRPELILKSKLFEKSNNDGPWYVDNDIYESYKILIDYIDKKLANYH